MIDDAGCTGKTAGVISPRLINLSRSRVDQTAVRK